MMNDARPWTDAHALANQLAGWRHEWADRSLFRVSAGQDWLRLHLEGDSRPGILLTSLPEVSLVFAHEGRLPGPVAAALPATKNHPLSKLLESAVFSSCGMFPDDHVAAFRLIRPGDRVVYLIHQFFGARGNTVLLDNKAKLLWSERRPPHALLAAVPPKAVWSRGEPNDAQDDVSGPALGHLTAKLLQKTSRELGTGLGRPLKSARKLVTNLARDFDSAEKGELYRRKAEALAAHLHEIPQGPESVEVTDPRDGGVLVITLNPALTPAANMEAWFRKARKADKGRDVIAERLDLARATVAVLEAAEAGLIKVLDDPGPALNRLAALQAWRSNHTDLLSPKRRTRGGRYGPEEPARPFRRYLVDGRWEVWVGRNNKENDELTHRASHSRDIWLHAQGVPGSHVILRTGGKPEQVPPSVLAKAAGLAALNSKARHSGLVPVIHTEKRYVRKPRKAPAGTAVCLREKSIFVEPGLGPGIVSI